MAEEWGGFLVDRVRVSPFGDSGHGLCVCDVQAFLCPGHGDIEKSCGFSDFLRSLLRRDYIVTEEAEDVLHLRVVCLKLWLNNTAFFCNMQITKKYPAVRYNYLIFD